MMNVPQRPTTANAAAATETAAPSGSLIPVEPSPFDVLNIARCHGDGPWGTPGPFCPTSTSDELSDRVALAEWLTENVLQHLYAHRQDLAEAAEQMPCMRTSIEPVRAQLLVLIRELRRLAIALRSQDAHAEQEPAVLRHCGAINVLLRQAQQRMADGLQFLEERHIPPATNLTSTKCPQPQARSTTTTNDGAPKADGSEKPTVGNA